MDGCRQELAKRPPKLAGVSGGGALRSRSPLRTAVAGVLSPAAAAAPREDVGQCAARLGISRRTDLLWIAQHRVTAPVPRGWEACPALNHPDRVFYYHHETGEVQWEHPLEHPFRELAACFLEHDPIPDPPLSDDVPSVAHRSVGVQVSDKATNSSSNNPPQPDGEALAQSLLQEFQKQLSEHKRDVLEALGEKQADKEAAAASSLPPPSRFPELPPPQSFLPPEGSSSSSHMLSCFALGIAHAALCIVIIYILPFLLISPDLSDDLSL